MSTIWPTTAENPQSASAACAPSEEAPAGPGEEFGFAAFTATELKKHSEGIARMTSTDVKRPVCASQEKTAIGDRWSVNSEQLTAITCQLLAANCHAKDACETHDSARTWNPAKIKNDQNQNCEAVKALASSY
jgi:hypothetical protein